MARAHNVGETRLRRRKRDKDAMRSFDALPQPLRRWMTQAVLPWSPASCHRIWRRAQANGAAPDDILARLDYVEAQTLSRDGHPSPSACRSPRGEPE
jgi:hypothetical protein